MTIPIYTAGVLIQVFFSALALGAGQNLPPSNSALDMQRFKQIGNGAVNREIQAKLAETVSVKDYGAIGDGVTDDTASIQSALNSGATKVYFPKGIYITGALTLPNWMHIYGDAYQPGVGSAGHAVELRFKLKSGVAITAGHNPVIENLYISNVGGTYSDTKKTLSGTTAVALSFSGNIVVNETVFAFWYECIRFGVQSYYVKTSKVHFIRSVYGYRAIGGTPYNVHIDAPHSSLTELFISGTGAHYPRNIKVFGGSIEGYKFVAQHFMDIAFFGTYFETTPPRKDVFAIQPLLTESPASVAMFGCVVYMNETARFVDLSGAVGSSLTSVGNVFDGVAPASSTVFFLPPTGVVHLAGDRFGSGHPASATYVNSITSAQGFNITFPQLPTANVQGGYSGVQMISPAGLIMMPLGAEPATKLFGMTVSANGSTWDPLTRASSLPYWVIWQGDRWGAVGGGVK